MDTEPPPWMRPGAPDPHAKKEAPPPPPAAAMDADEDIYGRETQEEADAKFMAALDANEARKAARQAALDLHAQAADAAWDERKPPPPPNDGYEEPSEEVLRMRPVMEKVFMATLTDPHYQKHPVPMVRSQHSHDACKELLDLCRLPEEELPQAHVIQRRVEQAWVDPDAWVRATAGSAAHAFGITQVADDFDAELRRKFGHLVTDEDRAGPRRWDPVGVFDDRWKSELVLPPLPEFEKHCNVRTDEEVREMMTRRTGAVAPRRPAAPVPRGRSSPAFRRLTGLTPKLTLKCIRVCWASRTRQACRACTQVTTPQLSTQLTAGVGQTDIRAQAVEAARASLHAYGSSRALKPCP